MGSSIAWMKPERFTTLEDDFSAFFLEVFFKGHFKEIPQKLEA